MNAELEIRGVVERIKGQVKVNDTVTGILWLLAAAIVYLLVVVAVDQVSPLERGTRLVLLAVLGGAMALGLALVLLLPTLRRVNDLYAARLIERQADDLFHNSLVSWVQISADPAVEPDVRQAVAAKTARDLRTVDLESVVSRRVVRWATMALIGAGALGVLFALTTPKSFGTSLGRAVGMELEPPTSTRILQIRPENPATVMQGDGVTISVDVGGEMPHAVTVRLTRDGTYWDDLAMIPREPGHWELPVANLLQDMRFRVRAGDARSDEHLVKVRPLPAVTRVRTRLTYPPYTLLAPATFDTGNVEALPGTRVEVFAETNEPITRAPLVVFGRESNRLPMTAATGATEARAEFVVAGDDSYTIQLADRDAERAGAATITWRVRALRDQPPAVELSAPAGTITVPENGSAAIGLRAADDYGLARLTLGWRPEKPAGSKPGAEQSRELHKMLADRARLSVVEELAVRPADLGLKAGDAAALWVAATDRCPDGPQEGRNEEIRLVVTKAEDNTGQGGDTAQAAGDGGDSGSQARAGSGPGDGDAKLTDQERRDLEKMQDALDKLRTAMNEPGPDGEGGDRQPGERQPKQPGERQPGKQPQPGSGGETSPGGENPGGPADDANNPERTRSEDAAVGERGTNFTESGRNDTAPPSDGRLLETVGAQIRRLDRELRDGTIDPKLLKDLGWDEVELRRMVSEYKNRFGEMAERASRAVEVPAAPSSPDRVTAVEGGPGAAGSGAVDTESGEGDNVRGSTEVDASRPDSRFRRLIDAYVRSVNRAETDR